MKLWHPLALGLGLVWLAVPGTAQQKIVLRLATPQGQIPAGSVEVYDYRRDSLQIGTVRSGYSSSYRPLVLDMPLGQWLQLHANGQSADTLIVQVRRLCAFKDGRQYYATIGLEGFVRRGQECLVLRPVDVQREGDIAELGSVPYEQFVAQLLAEAVAEWHTIPDHPQRVALAEALAHPMAHWRSLPINREPLRSGIYQSIESLQLNRPDVAIDGLPAEVVDSLAAQGNALALADAGNLWLLTDEGRMPVARHDDGSISILKARFYRIVRRGGFQLGIGYAGVGGSIPIGGRRERVAGPLDRWYLDWDTGKLYHFNSLPPIPRE